MIAGRPWQLNIDVGGCGPVDLSKRCLCEISYGGSVVHGGLTPNRSPWLAGIDCRINLPQANNTDQRLWVAGVLLLPHNEVCGCNDICAIQAGHC